MSISTNASVLIVALALGCAPGLPRPTENPCLEDPALVSWHDGVPASCDAGDINCTCPEGYSLGFTCPGGATCMSDAGPTICPNREIRAILPAPRVTSLILEIETLLEDSGDLDEVRSEFLSVQRGYELSWSFDVRYRGDTFPLPIAIALDRIGEYDLRIWAHPPLHDVIRGAFTTLVPEFVQSTQ